MDTYSDVDLVVDGPATAILLEDPLHLDGSIDSSNGILEQRHDCIANRLDDSAAAGFDTWKQQIVMPLHHGKTFEVTSLLEVRRRPLDVAEQDRHRGSLFLLDNRLRRTVCSEVRLFFRLLRRICGQSKGLCAHK